MRHPISVLTILALVGAAAGCTSHDVPEAKQQGNAQLSAASSQTLTSLQVADARATLEHIYATHFAQGQGNTADQSGWYTTQLRQLIKDDADAGTAQCGVGYLNWDPLTDAQDSVASYVLGAPRAQGDTVAIPVRIHSSFPGSTEPDEQLTVAMHQEGATWRIANIVGLHFNLVKGLDSSVAEMRAAPKADCGQPATVPDTARRDSTAETPSKPSASTPPRVLERHRLDLDGDGKPDELIGFADSLDPAIIGKLEFQLSNAGTRILQDTLSRGDAPPKEFHGTGNLIRSTRLYIADFEEAGRLLFLFGEEQGCCMQDLTIYRMGPDGPTLYGHLNEVWYYRSPQPRAGAVTMLVAGTMTEAAGAPTKEFVEASTYAPIVVYRLGRTFDVDSAATIATTKRLRGGFAGFGYRTDVYVLYRRDKSQALWDVSARRILR